MTASRLAGLAAGAILVLRGGILTIAAAVASATGLRASPILSARDRQA